MVSKKNNRWPTAIDLFSGSGSATAALKASHFKVIAAVDNDKYACETYRSNHPKVRLYEKDISQLNPKTVKNDCALDEPIDLLIICAPCQPFSNQNRNKKKEDKRTALLLESAKFVKEFKPKVIFVENVPGIASSANTKLLNDFKLACGSKYSFSKPYMIDAADYGVPQRRKRCIIMASRIGEAPEIPPPITPEGKRITVKKTISFLNSLKAGQKDEKDSLHFARSHSELAITRLKNISKDGGSRFELPEELELHCHKGKKSYPDVYGRMSWGKVAPTLTTGCTDITKGRFAHPEDDRAITPREAALLQSFPINYKFSGSPKVIATQIGNAIPFSLVKTFARTLRSSINVCE